MDRLPNWPFPLPQPTLQVSFLHIVGFVHLPVLDEANVGSLLTETLTADVEAVLADQTGGVCADTAAAGTLAVGLGTRVPDGIVRHVDRSWRVGWLKLGGIDCRRR